MAGIELVVHRWGQRRRHRGRPTGRLLRLLLRWMLSTINGANRRQVERWE